MCRSLAPPSPHCPHPLPLFSRSHAMHRPLAQAPTIDDDLGASDPIRASAYPHVPPTLLRPAPLRAPPTLLLAPSILLAPLS
eukprot:3333228-Pyramimonas_sp.AAC.1